jgi:predicted CopG family antitoxin
MGMNLDVVFARTAVQSIDDMRHKIKKEDQERFADVLVEFEGKLAKDFDLQSAFRNSEEEDLED